MKTQNYGDKIINSNKERFVSKTIGDDQVMSVEFATNVVKSKQYTAEHTAAMKTYIMYFGKAKGEIKQNIATFGMTASDIKSHFRVYNFDCPAVGMFIDEMIDRLGVDERGLIKL